MSPAASESPEESNRLLRTDAPPPDAKLAAERAPGFGRPARLGRSAPLLSESESSAERPSTLVALNPGPLELESELSGAPLRSFSPAPELLRKAADPVAPVVPVK